MRGLAAPSINRDDGPLDRQQVEKLGNRGDLVRLLVHRLRAQHQFLGRAPGRDHVHRALAAGLGFNSSAHFSTLFKRKYGISPRDLARR